MNSDTSPDADAVTVTPLDEGFKIALFSSILGLFFYSFKIKPLDKLTGFVTPAEIPLTSRKVKIRRASRLGSISRCLTHLLQSHAPDVRVY